MFWGTWSLDFVPVMPDCATTYPRNYVAKFFADFLSSGKFAPFEIHSILGSPYFWQELQYAFALWCSGLGLAYYCRGRGLSLVSSYGAGLLLSFCGYWASLFSAGHLGWFQWMTYGVFAFGLADRAVRKNKFKNWLLLGAVLAWGSMRQPDLWLLFTVFTGVYFIWCCARERKFPCWKGVVSAGIVFFLIGAPGFASAIFNDLASRKSQIEESKGGALTGGETADDEKARWIFATNWSLPVDETIEFIVPRINGDTSCPLTLALGSRQKTGVKPYTGALGRPIDAKTGNYRQHSLYVGFVTMLLAFAALYLARSRKEVWFFAVAALVFYLFSLGRNCEAIYRLVFALPMGDYIRAPVKWHHLTEFCLVVLAAYSIDAISRMPAVSNRFWAKAVLIAVLIFSAFDLARIDRLYLARVDVSGARRTYSGQNLTFASRQQLADPKLAPMIRSGQIKALANAFPGRSDILLVSIVEPRNDILPEPKPLPATLGIISLIASLAVGILTLRKKK